ncbi:MAG: DUF5676 family membrane protein [Gemmatimonadota bacterium]
MRINAKALGFATALGVAVAFTICTLVVAIAPGGTTAFLSYALHIDLPGLTRPLSIGGFIVGLLLLAIYFGVLVAAIAGIYNWGTQRVESGAAAGQRLHQAH